MVMDTTLTFVIIYVLLSFPLASETFQKLQNEGDIDKDIGFVASIAIIIGTLPYVPLYYILLIKEFFVYLYNKFNKWD